MKMLSAEDITSDAALIVLLFPLTPAATVPSDVGKLVAQYHNVRVRQVQKRQGWWWAWLSRIADPDGTARRSIQAYGGGVLYVAMQRRRCRGAVKDASRNVLMWVDGLLEGTQPLPFPCDVRDPHRCVALDPL